MKPILSLLTAGCVLTLVSCTSELDDSEVALNHFPADSVIRVTTDVAYLQSTRGGETEATPYTGSDFALNISPTGVTNDFTYQNVIFTKADDGGSSWAPSDGVERHWQSQTTAYTYSAYAPASGMCGTALTNNLLSYDLSQTNFDLLWTSGSGTAASLVGTTGSLPLLFSHAFCQFTIVVEVGNELYASTTASDGYDFETCPISRVTYTHSKTSGKFDVTTGTFSSPVSGTIQPDAQQATIVAATRTSDGTYTTATSYMPPAEGEQITVYLYGTSFMGPYSYTHSATTFVAGHSYTLKVKVGRSSINAVGVTVGDWIDVETSDDYKLTTF